MKFDLVGAGDSVLFQRIESITLPGFQGLVDLIKKADKLELLRLIDILVDGAYDISQRDLTLRFRGSLNQRVIDVQKSLHEHRVIELDI